MLRHYLRLVESEDVEQWQDKNVVAYRRDYRIAVDEPNNATYITAWTPDNKRIGSLTTRRMPDAVGKEYLGIGTASVDPRHRRNGIGLAMYQALLAHLGPQWKGIGSYLPDQANKRQVPKIWKRLGGHSPKGFTDHIVVER